MQYEKKKKQKQKNNNNKKNLLIKRYVVEFMNLVFTRMPGESY